MLHTQNLCFSFERSTPLLSFPDLHCETGKSLLILGASGCGKTTLLHLIGALLTPKEGNIYINNTEITALDAKKADHFRGKNIGIIFQKNHFVAALTVAENIQLAQQLVGKTTDYKAIKQLLVQLQIEHKAKSLPYTLSQGEQQRVAIARALINQPKLILADEPTSALDDQNCDQVVNLLKSQAQEYQAALVIVTHDNRLKKHYEDFVMLP